MGLSNIFQKAGDNSTQTSIQTVNVYGITEQRAREICREEYAVVARDMTQEAIAVASERVGQLEDRLLPKMAAYDEKLSAFADPAFLMSLRKAQISAACTDSKADYDILSELLVERAKVRNDKGKQIGITHALEIVGQVSDDALLGLALTYTSVLLVTTPEELKKALDEYDKVFARIIRNRRLPKDNRWIDELEILSALRISDNRILRAEELFSRKYAKHLVSGVKKESEDYEKIKAQLAAVGLAIEDCTKPHPMKPNYIVMRAKNIKNIRIQVKKSKRIVAQKPTSEQMAVLKKVAEVLMQDEFMLPKIQTAFMKEFNKRPYLKKVSTWWNKLNDAPVMTPVGEALANAYVRTYDPSVPKQLY